MACDPGTQSSYNSLNKKVRVVWEIEQVARLRFEEKLSLVLIAERFNKSIGWVRSRVVAATIGRTK